MANNTANFKDEIVYRGFVQNQAPDDAYEFDERWVQISPLGVWWGSSTTGEPIREELTPEALESLVQDFHANARQVPLDKDHNSAKAPLERDTEAFAWVEDLKLMSGGAEAFNGLYAKFKWRPEGVNLVKSRAYRFLSPVFQLDEENKPRRLISVALTNFPAFDTMPPVYNTTAKPEGSTSEDKETDMENTLDLDALKAEIVNECVKRMKTAAAEQPKTEEPATEETKEAKAEETSPEKKPVEQPKEPAVEESSKEEVIKAEALNSAAESAPTVTGAMKQMDEWRKLKGEDLMRWCRRHPDVV